MLFCKHGKVQCLLSTLPSHRSKRVLRCYRRICKWMCYYNFREKHGYKIQGKVSFPNTISVNFELALNIKKPSLLQLCRQPCMPLLIIDSLIQSRLSTALLYFGQCTPRQTMDRTPHGLTAFWLPHQSIVIIQRGHCIKSLFPFAVWMALTLLHTSFSRNRTVFLSN